MSETEEKSDRRKSSPPSSSSPIDEIRIRAASSPGPREILIVDDDPDNLKLLKRALEFENFLVTSAASGEEALGYLKDQTPDLVLLDINMPGLGGIETLRRLRSRSEYVAVIFISGNTKTTDVVSGLDSGADDYVRKPFDITEVMARIRAQLRIKDVKDELLAANKKLQDLVDFDELTGLLNMRAFYEKLDHELIRGRRFNHAVGIVMMDVDHFKRVNDEHDHLFGSFVLSQVGAIIRKNIRSVDFAARYGGDEFIVALTEATVVGTQMFAERLRATLESTIFDNGHDSMQLTMSMGFTLTEAKTSIDSQALIRAADHALYDAKAGGRNRVCTHLKID